MLDKIVKNLEDGFGLLRMEILNLNITDGRKVLLSLKR